MPDNGNQKASPRRCLRKRDLEKILNVGRTTRLKITKLSDFPKSFKLGSIEAWDSEEVYNWIDAQKGIAGTGKEKEASHA